VLNHPLGDSHSESSRIDRIGSLQPLR